MMKKTIKKQIKPNLQTIFHSLALAVIPLALVLSIPAATSSCCQPSEPVSAVEIINPNAAHYKELVAACMADDLQCGQLCVEILKQSGEYDPALEDQDPDIRECKILNVEATEVRMKYKFYGFC